MSSIVSFRRPERCCSTRRTAPPSTCASCPRSHSCSPQPTAASVTRPTTTRTPSALSTPEKRVGGLATCTYVATQGLPWSVTLAHLHSPFASGLVQGKEKSVCQVLARRLRGHRGCVHGARRLGDARGCSR